MQSLIILLLDIDIVGTRGALFVKIGLISSRSSSYTPGSVNVNIIFGQTA